MALRANNLSLGPNQRCTARTVLFFLASGLCAKIKSFESRLFHQEPVQALYKKLIPPATVKLWESPGKAGGLPKGNYGFLKLELGPVLL